MLNCCQEHVLGDVDFPVVFRLFLLQLCFERNDGRLSIKESCILFDHVCSYGRDCRDAG